MLQIMQENPELRDVLTEELRNLRQHEEDETKIGLMALEFQSKPAIEGGNQPVGLQITAVTEDSVTA